MSSTVGQLILNPDPANVIKEALNSECIVQFDGAEIHVVASNILHIKQDSGSLPPSESSSPLSLISCQRGDEKSDAAIPQEADEESVEDAQGVTNGIFVRE